MLTTVEKRNSVSPSFPLMQAVTESLQAPIKKCIGLMSWSWNRLSFVFFTESYIFCNNKFLYRYNFLHLMHLKDDNLKRFFEHFKSFVFLNVSFSLHTHKAYYRSFAGSKKVLQMLLVWVPILLSKGYFSVDTN